MKYNVVPFLLTDTENMSVVQSAKSTVVIKDDRMRNFIRSIDEFGKTQITTDMLQSSFLHKTEDAISFLLNNYLIKKEQQKNVEYENINIASNDQVFLNSMKFNSEGKTSTFLFQNLLDVNNEFLIGSSKDLYVIFLNPFDYKDLINLTKIIKNTNVIAKIAFYYNHRIYISNYYKADWYNPCPICFFGNIESTLRGTSKVMNTVSFQSLLDLIYSEAPGFKIVNNFTNSSIITLVDVLIKEFDILENRQINAVRDIDYNKNIVLSDEAIHWELCDCYE